MSPFYTGLCIGIFLGALAGLLVIGLCCTSSRAELEDELMNAKEKLKCILGG